MMDWLPLISAIVVSLVANLPGILLVRSQRRKESANAAGILTGKALDMVERLEDQVERLGRANEEKTHQIATLNFKLAALIREVEGLRLENSTLRRGAMRLEAQVDGLGHEPIWRVPLSDKE